MQVKVNYSAKPAAVARKLLDAAEALELEPGVVATSSEGFLVPEEVAEEAGLAYEGDAADQDEDEDEDAGEPEQPTGRQLRVDDHGRLTPDADADPDEDADAQPSQGDTGGQDGQDGPQDGPAADEGTREPDEAPKAPEAPSRGAARALWVDYARQVGGDDVEADTRDKNNGGLSRDQLADKYGSKE